jgi:acyl-CoA dehydrogenase family protein 9
MRQIKKRLKESGRSPLGLAFELLKLLVKGGKWPVAFDNRVMRKTLREAKKSAKAARILLLSGLLLYGRSIARGRTANREFLLRRITTLSLYTFGLLALLSEADQKQRAGELEAGDLRILECFAAEAKEARRANSRLFDSNRERLGSALFRERLDGGRRTEDGVQKTEDRRRRTEDGGQKTEDRGRKREARSSEQ